MFSSVIKRSNYSALCAAILMAASLPACHAATDAGSSPNREAIVSAQAITGGDASVKIAATETGGTEPASAGPILDFRGTISGDTLDFNDGKGPDSSAAQEFLRTGKNPYNDNEDVIRNGYTIYSTACSGCHGHLAEGKLGPALADDYWTYPANATDKGLFETIYGGGQGMMGPQRGLLTKDEILQVMSWLRSIYQGDPKKAKWKK
ncbi:cytochrome c-L [Methylophilaceae bacterium]|nr:cytochrome c-L [Methylophilaceae bacterium]